MTDNEIIAIRKATKPADYSQPWADTLAFGRAVESAALRPHRKWNKTACEDILNARANGEQFKTIGARYGVTGCRIRQVFLRIKRHADNTFYYEQK